MSEKLYALAKEYASLCGERDNLAEVSRQAQEAEWECQHLVNVAKVQFDAEALRILNEDLV